MVKRVDDFLECHFFAFVHMPISFRDFGQRSGKPLMRLGKALRAVRGKGENVYPHRRAWPVSSCRSGQCRLAGCGGRG
jgi:hypothetical protein